MMEFSEWLKQKIAEKQISQNALAEAIKENQPTIQRIISGETKNPRLKIVKKLEDYFNERPPLQTKQEVAPYLLPEHANIFETQLLEFYRKMTADHRDAVFDLANRLYLIDNPKDKKANPYPNNPKKEKI